jgi:methyl-accepting chemotaxis protein
MTLLIATIITLAFSTILISKIEQQTRGNLLINARVFDFSVQNLTDEASAEAKLVAGDIAIADALADSDISGLQTILVSYLESEKLGFLLVTDKSGVVLMRAHSPQERGDSIAGERAVEEALIGNSFGTIEFSPAEKFGIRASSPVYKEGKIVGIIVAGFPLDNAMVDRIKKITGLDTTLYQDITAIATTALATDGRSRLTGVTLEDNAVKDAVFVKGEEATARVNIRNTPYLASYLPIKNNDQKIIGMFSAAQPQADIIEIANATNRLTLVTVTVLLLLLAAPLYFLTRKLLVSAT